jgi:hypothetical protein
MPSDTVCPRPRIPAPPHGPRACTRCGVLQPADSFAWKAPGFRRETQCKGCRAGARRVRRAARRAAGLDRSGSVAPVDAGLRTCTHCRRSKMPDAFTPGQFWCRACNRLASSAYRRTPEYRAWCEAYEARPDRIEARKVRDSARHRTAAAKFRQKEYRRSPMGKLVCGRNAVRYRLRRATDPEQRDRLAGLVAAYDAEIARLRRGMEMDEEGSEGREVA